MFGRIKKYLILSSAIIMLLFFLFLYVKESDKTKIKEDMISQIEKENSVEKITTISNEKIFVDIKGEVKKPGVYEFNMGDKVIDAINKAGGLTKNGITSNINLSLKLKNEMVIYIFSKDDFTTTTSITTQKTIIPATSTTTKKTTNTTTMTSTTTTKTTIPTTNTTTPIITTKIIIPKDACNTIGCSNDIKDEVPTISVDIENPIVDNTKEDSNKININTANEEELTTLNGIGTSKAKSIIEYRNNNGLFNSIEDIKNVSGLGDALFEKIKDSITV